MKIDENPIVTLQAYCGIEYYYLQKKDLKNAFQTAIESIKKYNKPILWNFYKAEDFFNAKATIMYLDYFMENENELSVVDNVIDQFIKYSNVFPEFQNYLVLRKAISMEFFNAPLEDVIKAYKNEGFEVKEMYKHRRGKPILE